MSERRERTSRIRSIKKKNHFFLSQSQNVSDERNLTLVFFIHGKCSNRFVIGNFLKVKTNNTSDRLIYEFYFNPITSIPRSYFNPTTRQWSSINLSALQTTFKQTRSGNELMTFFHKPMRKVCFCRKLICFVLN